MTRSDIKKRYLIGTRIVVAARYLYGVPCVTDANKVDAFHHPALIDIETGDDALG
jgi:hypothetical protein